MTSTGGYPLPVGAAQRWEHALALVRAGAYDEAAKLALDITLEHPGFAPAWWQAAHCRIALGKHREAAHLSRRLAALPITQPGFALEVVRLLRRFELHEEVARVVDGIDWRSCREVSVLGQVSAELGPIGLYTRAEALLERAGELAPGAPRVELLRGTFAMAAGKADAASRFLRAAMIRSSVELPHARWMLTLQPDPERIDEDIAGIRAAMGRVPEDGEDAAYLQFGLHNLLHARRDHAAAWEALESGCRIKRGLVPYSRERQQRLFKALRSSADGPVCTGNDGASPLPVFVVGMHRSGTSLVERVLSGHPDMVDGGESYVFQARLREVVDHAGHEPVDEVVLERSLGLDLSEVAAGMRAHIRWRAGTHMAFTEKLPSNFLNLGFILRALPEARVLHMRRDPVDTCFSNLRTYFGHAAAYSYDQDDLVHYYNGYRQLMTYWHSRFPGRILDIDYQDFIESPEDQAARVMDFCGVPVSDEQLKAAVDVRRSGGYSATASIGSVRQGIQRNRGGAWRPYRRWLGPLLDGLNEN